MNYKFFLVIGSLIFLAGCFYNTTDTDKTKHTYFIQAPFDVAIISRIQETLNPIIEKIIEEEVTQKPDKDVPIFFFKKRAAITVYYVNDMYINAEPVLFSSLHALQDMPAPKNVSISSKVDFFGEPKDDLMALMDLVVHIDDPDEDLLLLNKEARGTVHKANEQYKNEHHVDMYDSAKSERHSYLPHLALGHLRPNYIKHLINDESEAEKIIERIKQRILESISNILSELPLDNRKIFFDKLSIYDLQKRIYIKDYELRP